MNLIDLAARPDRLLRDHRRLDRRRDRAGAGPVRKSGRVAVAFFGDGATNHGYFHECLNFAASAKLPRPLRLREQPLRRVHAVRGRHGGRRHRGAGARARHRRRDASTASTCGRCATRRGALLDAPRRGEGPGFMECCGRTASSATRAATRPPTASRASSTQWQQRDPLTLARRRLVEGRRPRPGARRDRRRGRAGARRASSRRRSPRRRRIPPRRCPSSPEPRR